MASALRDGVLSTARPAERFLMPRIRTVPFGPLWLGVTVDDFGKMRFPRFGFTDQHARNRVATAVALDLSR